MPAVNRKGASRCRGMMQPWTEYGLPTHLASINLVFRAPVVCLAREAVLDPLALL